MSTCTLTFFPTNPQKVVFNHHSFFSPFLVTLDTYSPFYSLISPSFLFSLLVCNPRFLSCRLDKITKLKEPK